MKNRYDYVIIPCADGCYSSPPRFLTNTDILRVCHGFSLIILLPYKVLLLQVKYFGVEVCVLGSNTAGIPMFAYSVCSASPALGWNMLRLFAANEKSSTSWLGTEDSYQAVHCSFESCQICSVYSVSKHFIWYWIHVRRRRNMFRTHMSVLETHFPEILPCS